LGTSSAKALIVKEDGTLISQASARYPILTTASGWAEQDPSSWWSAVKESMRKALRYRKVDAKEILAIGLSGQMHGTVLLDKNLEPLRLAIIWADRRSQNQCRQIYETVGKESVLETVCNPVMPGFMAPSLLWVEQNEPSIFARTACVVLPKDYVRLRLTGRVATDVSDASATLLFDVRRRKWSTEIISELGFPSELFPEIYESAAIAGEISQEASEETSLPKGIEVVAGGGDSPVGALGCGLTDPGTISLNIGSAGQVFAVLEEMRVDPRFRIHTFCHAVPEKWYVQGAILSAGLSLSWFIENLGFKKSSRDFNRDPTNLLMKEAESTQAGCGGLIFMPYLLGERSPHMDPDARGVFFGLRLAHKKGDMIRAIMEGVVYALRDSLEIFKELGVEVDKTIARGGGAKSRLWRQIQADIFNTEVMTVEVKEEAAFGAAILAGVGVRVYRDLREAVEEAVKVKDVEYPHPDRVRIYEYYYWKVYRRLYPLFKRYFRLL